MDEEEVVGHLYRLLVMLHLQDGVAGVVHSVRHSQVDRRGGGRKEADWFNFAVENTRVTSIDAMLFSTSTAIVGPCAVNTALLTAAPLC